MIYAKKLSEVSIYDAPATLPRSTGTSIDTGKDEELVMGLFALPASKQSEIDFHDIDEAYFVTRGRGYGLLWVRGDDKEPERWEVEPGTSVFIPKNVRHQLFNTGKEDIWLVWFFPRHPKVSGKLQSHPFSRGDWVKRSATPVDEWYPK